MAEKDPFELFLDVLDTCVVSAWYEANGWDIGNRDHAELERPNLTFSMLSIEGFSEDETTLVHEIHDALDSRAAPMAVNLHLFPEMFEVGGMPNKDTAKIVRLENPTLIRVFSEVENYYRSLGCPDTDKRFVESMYHPDATWPAEDMIVFMGS